MIAERAQLSSGNTVEPSQNAMLTFALNREWMVTALLVFVCAIPTVALWNHVRYLTGDSYQYLRAAQTLAHGQGFKDMSGDAFTVMSPLYPLIIGLLYRVLPVSDLETLARLISFAGATAAVVAFYWLVRVRYSIGISSAAAMLFALLPLRVWSGLWILSEGLYLGLIMLALVVVFRPVTRTWINYALGGVFFGFAYLTRPEAALYITAVFILVIVKLPLERKRALLFVAGFLLTVLPYHAWVYRARGTASSGRLQILLGQSQAIYEDDPSKVLVFNRASADGTSTQRPGSEMSLSAVAKRYLFFARVEIQRLLHLVGPRLLVIGILIGGGLLWLLRNARRARAMSFVDAWPFVLASWLLFLPFLHVEDRYLLQVIPAFVFVLLALMVALYRLANGLPAHVRQVPRLVAVALAFGFFLSYGYRLVVQVPARDSSRLARSTATWLAAQKISPESIVAQGPDLAFFSNSKHLWMANGEPENVVRYAQRNGARFIYVTSDDVPTALNSLLLGDVGPISSSLKFFHEETDGSARSRLFQVN